MIQEVDPLPFRLGPLCFHGPTADPCGVDLASSYWHAFPIKSCLSMETVGEPQMAGRYLGLTGVQNGPKTNGFSPGFPNNHTYRMSQKKTHAYITFISTLQNA